MLCQFTVVRVRCLNLFTTSYNGTQFMKQRKPFQSIFTVFFEVFVSVGIYKRFHCGYQRGDVRPLNG